MALTPAQLIILKAAILAETDPAFIVLRLANETGQMADWYKSASTFIAWKPTVSIRETGQAFVGAEWAGMTSANHTRLQTVAQYLMSYSPAIQGIRDMFNDIWSGAGGVATRAALLGLWKRAANKGERIFATGTGLDATPGVLTFEGTLTNGDIISALQS